MMMMTGQVSDDKEGQDHPARRAGFPQLSGLSFRPDVSNGGTTYGLRASRNGHVESAGRCDAGLGNPVNGISR